LQSFSLSYCIKNDEKVNKKKVDKRRQIGDKRFIRRVVDKNGNRCKIVDEEAVCH